MSNAARLKDTPPVALATLEAAEAALAELCKVEARIKVEEAKLSEREAALRAQAKGRVEEHLQRRDELVRSLTRFVMDHQELIPKGKRSLSLTHGEMGVRHLPGKLQPVAPTAKAKAEVAQRAAEELERLGKAECVRLAREVDLNALRKEAPELWQQLGYGLVGERDEPWVKPNQAVIEDLAGKLAPQDA